ncbi:MAG: hypothetical protein COB15_00895 [Flavobacteriales bacterium]|nr:MAG: hypothetical protein COB15_00895 [Flavobacteriales bacterium]
MKNKLIILLIGFTFVGCANRELRGKVKPFPDNKTYLVIEDDHGGGCGPILIDGKEWQFKIGEKGKIEPGIHTVKCGGELEITIKEGTTFYFDYWGP